MVTTRNNISRKIIDKLRLRKDKIISKKEIIETIEEYQRIYKIKVNILSLWTYLRKDNYVKRILKDYYYIYSLEEKHNKYCIFSEEELVFLVLKKMKIKWYLGLESALKKNNLIWQAQNVIIIINNYFSGIKEIKNTKFRFIKTKENKFNMGLIKKYSNNKVKYSYSDLEKTLLDFIYFNKNISTETMKKNFNFKIRNNKIKDYLKHYPKKVWEKV